jgi:hypothetical protein
MNIKCTQCGAKVPIETDTSTIRCPFCETALYVETDRTVMHYYMDPQVQAADLGPVIQRKLSYLEIKDPVNINTRDLLYFPLWRFDTGLGTSVMVAGAMPPVEDMFVVKPPAGPVRLFSPELAVDNEVVEPEVMLEDAAADAREVLGPGSVKFKSAAVVHLPFYKVTYTCQDSKNEAFVEAVSGEVFAEDWPSAPYKEKDRVLGMIAVATFAIFLVEAVAIRHPGLTLLAYAPTAAGVYFFARNTLKKMGW